MIRLRFGVRLGMYRLLLRFLGGGLSSHWLIAGGDRLIGFGPEMRIPKMRQSETIALQAQSRDLNNRFGG